MQYKYTAISIKVVPEQSGKVEYERKRLAGNRKKINEFLAIPSSLSRSYSTFPLCSGTTLIEIAIYTIPLDMTIPIFSRVQAPWVSRLWNKSRMSTL
jgi:hypothetical protein